MILGGDFTLNCDIKLYFWSIGIFLVVLWLCNLGLLNSVSIDRTFYLVLLNLLNFFSINALIYNTMTLQNCSIITLSSWLWTSIRLIVGHFNRTTSCWQNSLYFYILVAIYIIICCLNSLKLAPAKYQLCLH